jgi:hypothetical protein
LSPGATEAAIALLEARRRGGLELEAPETAQRSLAKHGLKINDLASEPLAAVILMARGSFLTPARQPMCPTLLPRFAPGTRGPAPQTIKITAARY